MKVFKILEKIIYILAISMLLLITISTAVSTFNISGGVKLFAVQTGSMEPKIHAGSIVVTKPFNNYQKEDIITFKSITSVSSTTHRIHEVKEDNDQKLFITKGDANDGPDIATVTKDLILGKVVFSIPYLGYPISFAKTKEGLIILIVIPVTLLIYSELLVIKKQTIQLIQKRKKRKLTTIEKIEEKIGKKEIKIEKSFKKVWRKIFKKKNKK